MILKTSLFITPFGEERTFHISLPDDYEESDERYPVMYMYDGQNLFVDEDASFGKSWGMEAFLQSYDKKFIVVGMECNHEGFERLYEYCPYKNRHPEFAGKDCRGDVLMDWFVTELKPWVDENFRTLPFRETTAIGGSSMGGLMALYTGVHHNDVFSKAACLSSATYMCMGAIFREIREAEISPDSRFFLSFGSDEFPSRASLVADVRRNLQINHELTEKGASCYPFFHMHGTHSEGSWEEQIPEFMDYLWNE